MSSEEHARAFLAHLNTIEPGEIRFTMELEENGRISVLDLSQERKEDGSTCFGVHYKKTHTNINIKEKSGHSEQVKRAVVQGFTKRAETLCSPENLEEEKKNIEKVFVANGFNRRQVQRYMKPKNRERIEEERKGIVSVPYVKKVSEQYKRILSKYGIMAAMKSGKKVKDLQCKVKMPLGDKKRNVVYKIECGCKKCVYIGQTEARFEERKKQHKDNVRKTREKLENGTEMDKKVAEAMMAGPSGKLYEHAVRQCQEEVKWATAKPIVSEKNEKQRKVKESIETYKAQLRGTKVLNICDNLDIKWKSLLEKKYKKKRDERS